MAEDATGEPRKIRRRFAWATRGVGSDAMMTATQELQKEDADRAVAIVGGALIEICLRSWLREAFYYDKATDERMFHSSGPLGSFAAKIDMGFLIGLYTKSTHRELVAMKDIRNLFAHDLKVISFEDQSIRARTMTLKLVDRYLADQEKLEGKAYAFDRKLPVSAWPYWALCLDLDLVLADPRERFLKEVQLLCWALGKPAPGPLHVPRF